MVFRGAKMKKQLDESVEKIETTIGELITIITEIALEDGKSEEESYELTSKTLERILRHKTNDTDLPPNIM